MFFHLQYIHLFRPFLKYVPSASPLPSHVSPRRICTANASAISKLMRLYKKTYNLRQICNIAGTSMETYLPALVDVKYLIADRGSRPQVYMIHSACIIHLLNLPEKTAKRDVIHGVKHLEEIAEDWLCARRTLCIISVLARKWNVELPEEASVVLQRADEKYGTFSTSDVPSPNRATMQATPSPPALPSSPAAHSNSASYSPVPRFTPPADVPTSTMPPDLLDTMARMTPAANLSNPMAKPSVRPMATATMTMTDTLVGVNGWSVPAVSQPMTAFPTYAAMQNNLSSGQTSQSGTSQVSLSPNSLFPVDGQDWFLKDGANWHQNFETWGMPQTTGVAASASMATSDSGLLLFRGLRAPDLDPAFDSLSQSMDNLDQLPGLD